MTPLLPVDPRAPDSAAIRRAASIITQGGCIVFPTRALYGLAADALNNRAVERIYAIKQRPVRNPLLVLISDTSQINRVALPLPESAKRLMARFWPGNLTLIVNAQDHLPPVLTADTGTIGIRQAGHPLAAALVRAVGGPITGTSANRSGQPGCHDIADLDAHIADKVDLILDCGPLIGGTGSTIVDTTQDPPLILREGSIPQTDLLHALDSLNH